MAYSEIYKKIGFQRELNRLQKQAYFGYDREIKMLRNLGVEDENLILEVGSGPGFYTKILLDNFNNSEVVSLDNDETLLNFALKMLNKDYSNRVSFMNDDITNSSMPNDYFDIVVARFVFQHLQDPIKALKEIYRILKPGGKVIIIDVDSELWGLTYPKNNLINQLNSSLSKFQSSLNGNREIGRSLLTLMKLLKFKNLNIEAVINHSDILGKENFKYNLDKELEKDPRFGNILKEYNDFFNLNYSSIMILKLFFYGEKPI
ncbi:class I SAM-dependent methyltransferase [Clostridium nigeriense]|uniref:class I SAM-dependent methyltransferase n=1 Tax=Clostridium nigeriense TaxID=1805470 RepID=UPI00082E923D|nr:class I SAM-dependent methyltransferase [Clostridium nigeriense]